MKVLAALLLLPMFAFGQKRPSTVYMTAHDLVKSCKKITVLEPSYTGDIESDSSDLMVCIGYVIGIVDGATLGSGGNANGKFPVCIPVEVSREELVRVVLKYADGHPEKLHYPGDRFVIEALSPSFPCMA